MKTEKELAYGWQQQIKSLQARLSDKDKKIALLTKEADILKVRALSAEEALAPVRANLNALTAEKGKWLRKARRNEN